MWKILLTLVGFALVFLGAILYGPSALLLPFILLVGFFVVFALMAFNAEIQADANPGIEKIEKPSFWFSSIYNAWLYKTNREGWAQYVSIISLIATAGFGVFIALIISMTPTPFSGLFEGWLTGMFLTGCVAIEMGSATHWKGQSKMKSP
jgi:hypothetical protein